MCLNIETLLEPDRWTLPITTHGHLHLASMANSDFFCIDVYDKSFANKQARLKSYVGLEWEDILNRVSNAKMVFDIMRPEVTHAKIEPYNRIQIMCGETKLWNGYIVRYQIKGIQVHVDMRDLMGFMDKRVIDKNYGSQSTGAVISDLISTMNTTFETEITFGTNNASGNGGFDWHNKKIGRSIYEAAKASGDDVWIDLDKRVQIGSKGSDKSNTVALRFNEDRFEETNAANVQIIVDGDDMVNRLHATGTGAAGSVIRTDADARDYWGMLEGVKSYSASDGTTLQNVADEDLEILAALEQIPRIAPISSRVPINRFDVGDTIMVRVKRGFYDLEAGYRVIRKKYKVASDGRNVRQTIELAEKPTFVRTILTEIAEIEQRVYNLEQT